MSGVYTMLVLVALGILWPVRYIWWFPITVALLYALSR